jgi:hypothetical protein
VGLNISPETVQRLRRVQQSQKFQTFTPATQERLNNLSLQFDEEGNKHFITREDNVFTNPSLESLGKSALLQVPFLGSSLAAPTERNLLGNIQRGTDALKSAQAGTFERAQRGETIEKFQPTPGAPFLENVGEFGRTLGRDIAATGSELAAGFTAPRDTVQSAFGIESKQDVPISNFISERFKKNLEKSGALDPRNPIDIARAAPTVLKATANDLVGVLNDLSLDVGLNAIFLGGGKAISAGASQLAGTRVGVELAKVERFINAVEKTAVGKGFRKRFGQNYGDFVDAQFKAAKGAVRPTTGTDLVPTGQPTPVQAAEPLGLAAPKQLGLPNLQGQAPEIIAGQPPALTTRANPPIEIPTRPTPPARPLAPKPATPEVTAPAIKPEAPAPVAETPPPSPLQQGIAKATAKTGEAPLTQPEIAEATETARTLGKNLAKEVSEAAKANKRSVINEINARKDAIQKQVDSGKLTSFERVVQRKLSQQLDDLIELRAKRAGKKIAVPKKSKPISNTNISTKLPKGKFSLTDLGKKATPKEKFDLTKVGKKEVPPAKVEKPKGLAAFAEAPKGTGTGQFTLINESGKPTGGQFPTKESAEGQARTLNKQFKREAFKVRELTKEELPKPKEKPKKKTPLEEGISGPEAKPPAVKKEFKVATIAKKKVDNRPVTKEVAVSLKKFLDAENKTRAVTRFTGKGKSRELINTPDRIKAQELQSLALEDAIETIIIEMDLPTGRAGRVQAIGILNKLLKPFRSERGSIEIGDLPFTKGKKARARRIKKLKRKRELNFAKNLKKDIAGVAKSAKEAGLSVDEFIRANPSAFPGAPKDLSSLQNALREIMKDLPVTVANLAKNDIVQFRPAITTAGKKAGDIGIVEAVGDVIKVRFKDGLSTFTPKEAVKFLRESGTVFRLKGLPTKKVDDVVANILARNPKHKTLAEVANAAVDAALKNPNDPIAQAKATQLTKRLMDAISNKTIDINDIPSVARAHGLTSNQLIADLVQGIRTQATEAGQTLNVLSQLQKKLKKIVTPEEMSILFPEGEVALTPNMRFMTKVGSAINRTANIFKGFLTSQFKTAARNAFVQGGITLTEYTNQIAIGAYQKLSGSGIRGKEFAGVKAYNEAIKGAVKDIISFSANLKKLKLGRDKERALMQLLKEYPIHQANLFKAPIHDVVVNEGFVRVINAANILQETVFRTIFVEAELAKFARQHGTTLSDLKFFKRHADIVPAAVEQALKNTFASDLQNTLFSGDVIKFFKKFPALGFALGNPFVRFFLNNFNMMVRKSPIPLTNFFSPEFQRAFQGPNNAKQVKILSEALQGVVFLAVAMGLRSEKFAGPKFYQIDLTPNDKADDRFFDTRPFAPLPQYLFSVELAKNMSGNKKQTTLTGTDMVQGMLSVSRIAGTGLVGLDLLRSEPFVEKESPEQAKKNRERLMLSFAGQILSAPTVPLAQFQDIIGVFDPEENKFKSTQQNPFFGPSLNNLPFAKRLLPDLQQVGRSKPQQPSGLEGMIEFGTGLRIQRVNEFEQVLARHGISSISPAAGDPAVNQRIIGEMNSEEAQKVFRTLINDPLFKNEKDAKVRKDMLSKWVSTAFLVGKESVLAFDKEAGDFLIDKKIDKKLTAANKKFADQMMDITLELLGKNKRATFSREIQKILSEPNP